MRLRRITVIFFALGLLLVSCRQRPEVFTPELYAWEEARDSIVLPCTIWRITCGSPDAAIYRYDAARLAPGVSCGGGWLFDSFMLCETPVQGEDLPDYWLNPAYGTVVSLEKAIADAALVLGEPPAKRTYTVSLPPEGTFEEYVAFIDRVRAMAAALDTPHLEFFGFTSSTSPSERVLRYTAACHEAALDDNADVTFDYSAVENIMDQPGVRSLDGKRTLKDVPSIQKALKESLASSRGGELIVMDCGSNTLVQLSLSPYSSDKDLLEDIYSFIQKRNPSNRP